MRKTFLIEGDDKAMGRIGLAFKVLLNGAFAKQVAELQAPAALEQSSEQPAAPVKPPEPEPVRSAAVTLLAALQREARLLDFFKEPIADYSDAQIGAAVRDVHRQTNAVLDRMFNIQPLLDAQENSVVQLPTPIDAGTHKLVGAVGTATASSGVLMHHGWKVTKCELPQFTGSAESALVVAPAEIEIKAS